MYFVKKGRLTNLTKSLIPSKCRLLRVAAGGKPVGPGVLVAVGVSVGVGVSVAVGVAVGM